MLYVRWRKLLPDARDISTIIRSINFQLSTPLQNEIFLSKATIIWKIKSFGWLFQTLFSVATGCIGAAI